ncbi:hypothetical protein TNCV_2049911 [Trichonephila clavipes]|nr:hypothetical protein TNCV_2049911 [Trichonephila clavipes]
MIILRVSMHVSENSCQGEFYAAVDSLKNRNSMSKLRHVNMRSLGHDRLNVHQPLCNSGFHWHQDINPRLVNESHDLMTMMTRLP